MKAYFINILTSLSQCLNALLGGHPNMTLSARCFYDRNHAVWGRLRYVIDALFWFDPEHCASSWAKDVTFCNGLRTL